MASNRADTTIAHGMASDVGQIGGRRASGQVKSFSFRSKKDIEIVFEGQDAFVPTYTTLDRIQGHVNIKFDKDTPFDKLDIVFIGQADTWVEKVQSMTPAAGKVAARHNLLRSIQPPQYGCLPEDGIAKANVTYTHPFCFIVPEKLLDIACQHKTLTRTANPDPTKQEHLSLPPSLGDSMVSGIGARLMPDMSPEMAKITYTIKAVAKKRPTAEGQRTQELASQSQKVRIVPAREAKPPLEITDENPDYHMRVDKSVKKGSLFPMKSIGRIVAEAAQPQALMLPSPRSQNNGPVSTSTVLNLRFDPRDADVRPPILDSLAVKLKVYTYFATDRFPDIASKSLCQAWHAERNHYSEVVDISDRPVSTVDWTRHDTSADSSSRRTSRQLSAVSTQSGTIGVSEGAIPTASSTYSSSLPFYTAQIRVPIILLQSDRKVFPPTFHSCFISRVYALSLRLSYRTPKKTIPTPSLTLKVPIQIGSQGNPDARPLISDEEMAAIMARQQWEQDLAESDDFYRPRRATFAETDSIPPMDRMRLMSVSESVSEGQRSSTADASSVRSSIIRGDESQAAQRQSSRPSLARTTTSSTTEAQRVSDSDSDYNNTTTSTTLQSNNPFNPSNLQRHQQIQSQSQPHPQSDLPSYTSALHQSLHAHTHTPNHPHLDSSSDSDPDSPTSFLHAAQSTGTISYGLIDYTGFRSSRGAAALHQGFALPPARNAAIAIFH